MLICRYVKFSQMLSNILCVIIISTYLMTSLQYTIDWNTSIVVPKLVFIINLYTYCFEFCLILYLCPGPMVYGTSYCSVDNQAILKTLGCADSKVLSEQARDDIFDGITKQSEILGWAVHIISPTTISNCSFRRYLYEMKLLFYFCINDMQLM